jgi:hypothetical protein
MDSVSVEATLGRAIGLTSPRLSQFPRTRITASPRLLPRLAVWRAACTTRGRCRAIRPPSGFCLRARRLWHSARQSSKGWPSGSAQADCRGAHSEDA